ncbi:MAG: nucleotide-binding protein [Muribaculaceae bacterium]|nr:nucleotide-binding protein [Muribaculaceae bacterium]
MGSTHGKNEECVIFYSWQSDIKAVRNFIYGTLQSINGKDMGLDIRIDHDTYGLPGAPRIEDAIIGKIRKCDVFVADVTMINSDYEGRKVCNPNVLIELGVAIGTIGWDRIILLCCRDYGTIDDLPFDFNHNRIISFSIGKECRASERKLIKSRIISSIGILHSSGLIHGGTPEALEVRAHLYSVVTRSIGNALNNNSVVVTTNDLEKLESLRSGMEQDHFDCLHRILSALISATLSPDDKGSLLSQLLGECVEPAYLAYRHDMPPMEISEILIGHVYEALNELLPVQSRKPFSFCRCRDGRVVFSSDPEKIEVRSVDDTLLVSGYLNENGYFCGFQRAVCADGLYVGHYENGLRSGNGTLYKALDGDDFKYPVCSGEWENDRLKNGIIYSCCSYLWWMNEIPDEGLPSEDFLVGNCFILDGLIPDVEDGLCPVYDVKIENGLGRVIKESFRRYPEETLADKNARLDTYLVRMSAYDIQFNDVHTSGHGIGINYDLIIEKYLP